MGGGGWDPGVYASTTASLRSSGKPRFAHTAAVASGTAHGVHESLDPKRLNTFDQKVRECFDSDEHPNATPIMVFFDETGSMGEIPTILVEKLQNLFGLLLRKGYCVDPQIAVGGVGDASNHEQAPLQVAQFESDNRVDEALGNIYLEGNGGGGGHESYELAMWFVDNFIKTDAFTKRNEKGFLFFIGDERCYSHVKPAEVEKYIGETISEPIPVEDVIASLKEKWNIFWIYPAQAFYYRSNPDYVQGWRDRLGAENVIVVEDVDFICETIGSAIGLATGAVDDFDELADDLDSIGAGAAAGTVSKALAHLKGSVSGALAVSEGPEGLGGTGTDRL